MATPAVLNPTKLLLKESLKIGKQIEKHRPLSYFFSKQQKKDEDKLSIQNIKKRFREKDASLSKNFEEFRTVSEQLNLCKRGIPWYQDIPNNFFPTYKPDTIKEVAPGTLLLSHPILRDNYWSKTVILILHMDEHNAFGVILNQWTQENFHPYKNTKQKEGYWEGGPVSHVSVPIFTQRDLFPNPVALSDGFYFTILHTSAVSPKILETIPKSDYRLFVGFCVWTKSQLQNEIENQHDWVIMKNPVPSLFGNPENIPETGIMREGYESATQLPNQFIQNVSELNIPDENITAIDARNEKGKAQLKKGELFQFYDNPTTPYDAASLWSKVLKSHWVHNDSE
jgi:putative AlgH/UPF0301 family transcriptional regulator